MANKLVPMPGAERLAERAAEFPRRLLRDISGWKAVKFNDRTILRTDLKFFSVWEIDQLCNLIVEPMKRDGWYKVVGQIKERHSK